jgi:hypothetical protein
VARELPLVCVCPVPEVVVDDDGVVAPEPDRLAR